MAKCVICGVRPANGGGYCQQCRSKVKAMTKAKNEPQHYLTYREHVVGLFPNGGGTLKAQLLNRSAENLPKRKTLDLNHYCEGFDRATIKSFKACVLKLAHA